MMAYFIGGPYDLVKMSVSRFLPEMLLPIHKEITLGDKRNPLSLMERDTVKYKHVGPGGEYREKIAIYVHEDL